MMELRPRRVKREIGCCVCGPGCGNVIVRSNVEHIVFGRVAILISLICVQYVLI